MANFAQAAAAAFPARSTTGRAQGEVLHNDDTTVKILALLGERGQSVGEASASSRSGLYTSGVVATRDGRRMAMFFSGRQHAGENLADVLRLRAAELERPIQSQ